jgi:hypothetical protein
MVSIVKHTPIPIRSLNPIPHLTSQCMWLLDTSISVTAVNFWVMVQTMDIATYYVLEQRHAFDGNGKDGCPGDICLTLSMELGQLGYDTAAICPAMMLAGPSP